MTLKEKSYIGKNKYDVDTKMYFHQDVKEAVLQFKEVMEHSSFKLDENYIKNNFKRIFGDFEETNK